MIGLTSQDVRRRDFYDRARDIGYTPLPIDPGARRIDLNTPFTVDMKTGGASLQLDKTLLGKHTLTSITAWRFWDWDPSLDGDRTGAAITTASNLPTNQRQWSQELRISSPSGQALEYTAGLYYFWQHTKEVPFNTYGRDAAKWLLGPAFPDEALDNLTRTGLRHRDHLQLHRLARRPALLRQHAADRALRSLARWPRRSAAIELPVHRYASSTSM